MAWNSARTIDGDESPNYHNVCIRTMGARKLVFVLEIFVGLSPTTQYVQTKPSAFSCRPRSDGVRIPSPSDHK